MNVTKETFVHALCDPSRLADMELCQWDAFLPMAHQLGMVPRLVAQLDALGLSDDMPTRVKLHLESALLVSRRHEQLVRWEVAQINPLLSKLGVPIVLLKGTAYLFSGVSISHGRVYSDVDILVPRDALGEVERILLAKGWEQPEEMADQAQYYQRWMHELLPLVHTERRTKLDVHHNILPAIDPLQFDPKILLADARPLDGSGVLHVLSPTDMALHNVVHLFRNGDYRRAFRNLLDLDQMLVEFARTEANFFDRLLSRAKQLRLLTPCFLAARYASRYLETAFPSEFREGVEPGRPRWPPLWLLDRLFELASFPTDLVGNPAVRRYSLWLLERYPLNLVRKSILPKLERWGLPSAAPRIQ